MRKLDISTTLQGKSEVFKVLAVAHATGKPVLLVGPPGTGKTKALLDYSLAVYQGNKKEAIQNAFILETDEGTRSKEIKGQIDVEKLVTENKYKLNSPITSSKFVLINEVEKASASLRNAMLSVMNEKFLFNGKSKVPCTWELFCASCNSINGDKSEAPFWDRFVFKQHVDRISASQMVSYLSKKNKTTRMSLNIPNKDELAELISQIPKDKLKIFVDMLYKRLSDRTLSFTPAIIAAVSVVYELDLVRAMVQTANLLAGKDIASDLAGKLESKELTDIRSAVEMIGTLDDYDQINDSITHIENLVTQASRNKKVTESDIESLQKDLDKTLRSNPAYTAEKEAMEEMTGMDLSSTVTDSNYANSRPE
jgi:MoxR-like ATPase